MKKITNFIWSSFLSFLLSMLGVGFILFLTLIYLETTKEPFSSPPIVSDYEEAVVTNSPGRANEMPLTEEVTTKHKPITIAFTGDILLDKSVGAAIEQNGVDYPFQQVSTILNDADLAAGNLETSVSTRGLAQDKQYTFRSKPETLQGLVNSGYDMVSLANNHTLDFGVDALYDTLDNLKKYNIGYSGAGKNEEEAFEAYYTNINGKRIAILGISRVLPEVSWFAKGDSPGLAHGYQPEPMMSYVKKAVADSDYTIVMIHWNKERMDYPEAYAHDMAKDFIDAGVDSVIGGHSHSLMGIEYYKNTPIYYSLGNFVFTNSINPKGNETMIVTVTYDNGEISTKLVPAKIENGQPRLMDDSFNQHIIQKLNKLSFNATIDTNGNVSQSKQ